MMCNSCIYRKIVRQHQDVKQICGYTGIYIPATYSCHNWRSKHNIIRKPFKSRY